MFKSNGFTLIELMTTCSILAIIAVIFIPNFNTFLVKMRVDNEISHLHRMLLLARNSAINFNHSATLCPLSEGNSCTTQWEEELSVFIDADRNHIYNVNGGDILIQVKPAIKELDKLQYGRGRRYIAFGPEGVPIGWGANGTFKYCPANYEEYSRAIVVSTSGRFYPSNDDDHDGRDETRNGKNIECRT